MKGGKGRFLVLSASFIALMYMVFLPRPMGGELLIIPAWSVSRDPSPLLSNEKADPLELIGFRLGPKLGYISPEGRIVFYEQIDYNVALHDKYFLNYSALARNLVVRGNTGEFIGNLGVGGYPFILKNKLYILSLDGSGISEWSVNGDLLWDRKFDALITAVSEGETTCLVGLLNGTVHLLDEKGQDIFKTSPQGSAFPVILQTGLVSDSRYFAVVSGIGPQKLSIFEKTKETYRLISALNLKSDYRRNLIAQSIGAPYLFLYEQPRGIGIYHFSAKKNYDLEIHGAVRSLSDQPLLGLLLAVTEGDENLYGTSFLPSGRRVLQFPIEKNDSFFCRQTESFILLGIGTRIFRIDFKVG